MATLKQVEAYLAEENSQKLIKALSDKDLLVRRFAAKALGLLRDSDATPYLLKAISENTDQYVIKNAMESLKTINTNDSVDSLILMLFARDNYRSRLAETQLKEIPDSRSRDAVKVKELILDNDYQSLRDEPAYTSILRIIMDSEQYQQWPSGKRKQIGEIAISAPGNHIPEKPETIRDLAEMGIFVGGIHDLGDLIKALDATNPSIRIKAAERIGRSSSWLGRIALRRKFKQELVSCDSSDVCAAISLSLLASGDSHGYDALIKALYRDEGERSVFAARSLAAMRTEDAIQSLFQYCINPPTTYSHKNRNVVLAALESAGPHVVDIILARLHEIPDDGIQLLIDLIVRVKYPEATVILSDFVINDNDEIRDAAISGLVRLNSNAAAMSLRDLAGYIPEQLITSALARMSAPQASRYLSAIKPENTSIIGKVIDQNDTPIVNARVTILREHYFSEKEGWGVMPASYETMTGTDGMFYMSILPFDEDWHCSIKIITPAGSLESQIFSGPVTLKKGRNNNIHVKIDRKYSHLSVQIKNQYQ